MGSWSSPPSPGAWYWFDACGFMVFLVFLWCFKVSMVSHSAHIVKQTSFGARSVGGFCRFESLVGDSTAPIGGCVQGSGLIF